MKRHKTLKVMFDAQIFLLQKHGGISRYFVALIKEFEANPKLGIVPILSSRASFNEHALSQLSEFGLFRVTTLFGRIHRLLGQALFNSIPEATVDIVHFTFYLPGFQRKGADYSTVVTLFDMIPELNNNPVKFWNPHFMKRSYIERASAVLSISKTSTKEMLTHYGFSRSIPTTYLGVGPEYRPNLARVPNLNSPYFVFVGKRTGYKDFETALLAFSQVAKELPALQLQLVGGEPITRGEQRRFRRLQIVDRVAQRSFSDTELPRVYANALALLYPTRREGFGLPLVEAMASGTVILASDTEINREICGKVANYFKVGSIVELSAHMFRLLKDPSAFSDRVTQGIVRARQFNWSRCAEITAKTYWDLQSEKLVKEEK